MYGSRGKFFRGDLSIIGSILVSFRCFVCVILFITS